MIKTIYQGLSDFNRIAPFYDFLAKIMFGQNLLKAQQYFIRRIPHGSNILILGGGNGKILNYIFENVQDAKIDFVEPSENMLKLAQKNTAVKYAQQINFIRGDQLSIPENSQYSVLIIFFVYDLFKQDYAIHFTRHITKALRQNGLLLFADFFKVESVVQKLKLWSMYRFFRLISGIAASDLPDYDALFRQFNLTLKEEKCFMNCFVKARLYVKP